MKNSVRFRNLLIFCALTAGYLLLGFGGMEFAAPKVASPIWPAGGLAVGATFLFGYWAAPAAFLGSLLLSSTDTPDIGVNIGIGIGAMLPALFGRFIVRKISRRKTFKDYTDVFATIISSVFGASLSATVSTLTLLAYHQINVSEFSYVWSTWWSGDAIGILMVMPLFLELRNKSYLDITRTKIFEAVVMLILMLLLLYFTFTLDLDEAYLWLAGPLFILTGVRTGRLNAAIILLIVSCFVAALTVMGHGPFQYGETNRSFIYVQTLIAGYSISVLFIKQMGAGQKIRSQYIVGLFLTSSILFILTSYTTYFEKKNILDEYHRLAEESLSSLDKAGGLYSIVLDGTSGLFTMKRGVTREEWKAYVGTIHLASFLESVRGLGFISHVENDELEGFLKTHKMKRQAIHSESDQSHNDHFIITYYEPDPKNFNLIGLDLGTENKRRKAAEEARRLNKTIASEPITLVTDNANRKAFTIYHPAYSLDKRFLGWTFAPMMSDSFFGNNLSNYTSRLKIRIFVNNEITYSTKKDILPFRNDEFFLRKQIKIFGINHDVHFYPTDLFFRRHSDFSVGIPFILNFIALIIIALIREQITFNMRAEKLVQERTHELDQSRMQLIESSKMASLGEMASSMAHEINNPLTIIQGKLQVIHMILSDLKINDRSLLEELGKIRTTTERIEKIVKGLRNFSRAANHDPFELIPLKEIVNETMDLCAQKIKAEGIKLNVADIPSVHIKCRPAQISQVLINLLNNSRDAVHEFNEKWIDVTFKSDDKKVTIFVTDSGPGIPEDVAKKMMEPFFTTKEVGKGTGLGLSISKGIISNHDGKIWLERSSRHTCFALELECFYS